MACVTEMSPFAARVYFTLKLTHHVRNGNHSRVADYVAHAIETFRHKSALQVDPDAWEEAKDFMRESGYKAAAAPGGELLFVTPDNKRIHTGVTVAEWQS